MGAGYPKQQDLPGRGTSPRQMHQSNRLQSHIEAMIQMISKNWENPTFYPTIDLFRRFRAKIEATE